MGETEEGQTIQSVESNALPEIMETQRRLCVKKHDDDEQARTSDICFRPTMCIKVTHLLAGIESSIDCNEDDPW